MLKYAASGIAGMIVGAVLAVVVLPSPRPEVEYLEYPVKVRYQQQCEGAEINHRERFIAC